MPDNLLDPRLLGEVGDLKLFKNDFLSYLRCLKLIDINLFSILTLPNYTEIFVFLTSFFESTSYLISIIN